MGGRNHPVMNRRTFLCGLTGTLAAPLAAETPVTGRVYRIGVLRGVSRMAPDLHYVEGLT